MLHSARSRKVWTVAASAGLLTVLVIPVPASSAPPHTRIEHAKGIGGVNIGYQRGKVERFLGSPQVVTAATGNLYVADYRDDGLGVYYLLRNQAGGFDQVRDRFDQVGGVVTFSRRFTGTLAPGKSYTGGDCLPADRREAPGGGPRRVAFCLVFEVRYRLTILYMSVSSPTRASQRISGVGVFKGLVGAFIWDGLEEEVLNNLGCESLATCK